MAIKTPKGDATALLNAKGIAWVCEHIVNGEMLTAVARDIGVSLNAMTQWIAADQDRSACAREARKSSASAYADMAQQAIAEAGDQFELSKAKELAHHYRWKSSKLDPGRFGEKVTQEVTGLDGGPVQFVKTERIIIDSKA